MRPRLRLRAWGLALFLGDQVLEPKLTLTTFCALPLGQGRRGKGRRQKRRKRRKEKGEGGGGGEEGRERKEQKPEGVREGGEGSEGAEGGMQEGSVLGSMQLPCASLTPQNSPFRTFVRRSLPLSHEERKGHDRLCQLATLAYTLSEKTESLAL